MSRTKTARRSFTEGDPLAGYSESAPARIDMRLWLEQAEAEVKELG